MIQDDGYLGVSRYTEFLQQHKEHPEWFDFNEDYFRPQEPWRKKSLTWNGKKGIDVYTNMINKEYKK